MKKAANNPRYPEWGGWWPGQEATLQDLEGAPAGESRHRPHTVEIPALMETGKPPPIDHLNHVDQYMARVRGSGLLARRGRKSLWIVIPATDVQPSCGRDRGMEWKVDSAWGARGRMTRSADSSKGLDGGFMYGGIGAQDAASQGSQCDGQEVELGSNLGEGSVGAERPNTLDDPRRTGLRHTAEGRTHRARR